MKTLLLQIATPEIECYAKYSTEINRHYAIKHGYDYKVINTVSKNRHPAWGKVEHTINHIKEYDRLFLLDADAFVNNDQISLDNFSSNKIIKICENGDNGGELLNTGSIIFLNSPLTIELLKTWYMSGENTNMLFDSFWDQSIFNSLHNNGNYTPIDNRFVENVEVFELSAFNSWWMDYTKNYKPEQFIQHIMARCNITKTIHIKDFHNKKFNK